MRKSNYIFAMSVLAATPTAHSQAPNLSCYVNPRTDAHTCYNPREVREKDGIRQAPIYSGGPNQLRKTSMSIHINCKTEVVHLKDKDGVTFAAGYGSENESTVSLRRWICAEKIHKK